MKLIAKTLNGSEYLHSTKQCYMAPDNSSAKMCEMLNKAGYKLSPNEKWHIYDWDFTMELYCNTKLRLHRGTLTAVSIYA